MRLLFGPHDEDAFYAARDELASRFERSPRGHDLGWVAVQLLDFKWGYLDGDLSRWQPDEVEEILLGLFPTKVIVGPDDLGQVVTGFAAFLRFLGDEAILPGAQAARLAELVKRLAPRFRSAALDEGNWSMGKRLWSLAVSQGVDPSDPDAVRRFMEDFNQRPFSERDAVLGPLPALGALSLEGASIGPLPPIVLASYDELESAARDTVCVERLCRLVGYVGEGRPSTDKGNLTLADGKALVDLLATGDRFDETIGGKVFKTKSSADLGGVDLAFRMAVESGMLARKGKKILPGPNAGWVDDPLSALYGAWLALLNRIGPTQYWYQDHRYGWDWYAQELDASLPMVLMAVYRDGDVPVEEVAQDMWDHLTDCFDLDDVPVDKRAFQRTLVEGSLRRAFDLLGELGLVEVEGVVEVKTAYDLTERSGGVVDLTPLGKWAMQRLASRVTSAPIVGALRESTAALLLTATSDISEVEAIAEIDAWVKHRGSDAAGELVEALRTTDQTGRGLGFHALLRIGPGAADAVSRLADDPELAPYMTVWRIETLAGAPDDMDCAGRPERFVRLLGAVLELWGPVAAVSAWAGPAAGADGLIPMLGQAWRVKRPETEQVLTAIVGEHPDKVVAAAARKALFKHRCAD